jgi:hypothetical protein
MAELLSESVKRAKVRPPSAFSCLLSAVSCLLLYVCLTLYNGTGLTILFLTPPSRPPTIKFLLPSQ